MIDNYYQITKGLKANRTRNLLVISDGHFIDETFILDVTKKGRDYFRLFTLSIGLVAVKD